MTFSDLVDVVQIVAMFAALGAIYYAQEAVIETRALRREDRVARLLELVADLGDAGTGSARGHAGVLLDVPKLRLRAAISATGEPLPRCQHLLAVEWPSYSHDSDAVERETEALDAVAAALDEVATLLVRLRAEGSSFAASEVASMSSSLMGATRVGERGCDSARP